MKHATTNHKSIDNVGENERKESAIVFLLHDFTKVFNKVTPTVWLIVVKMGFSLHLVSNL